MDTHEEFKEFVDVFWNDHHIAITEEKPGPFRADKFGFIFRDFCDTAF